MSTPTTKVPARRLRQLRNEADRLVTAKEKAEEAILVFIHNASAEGVSNAGVAAMFPRMSASGIPAKVAKGAEILAERRGSKGIPG